MTEKVDRVVDSESITPRAAKYRAKLNEFAQAFVECGGNVAEAARKIGVTRNTAIAHSHQPYAIARIKEIRLELAKLDAKKIAVGRDNTLKVTGITKDALAQRLWELSQLSPDDTNGNITGQVRACDSLGELLGFKVKLSADVTREFEGRTQEELDYFAKNGYFPVDSKQPRPN